MVEHPYSPHGASHLLELLRRVGREEPGAVGFGRPRQAPVRRAALALLAALPAATEQYLAAAREGAADAAFIPLSGEIAAAPQQSDGSAWPVCGLTALEQPITPAALDAWQAAGIDAVALRPGAALAACFSPRRQGVLALVDQHLPLDGLRAMAALTVDGYVLRDAGGTGRLSGDDLLWLALAAGLLRGPVMLLSSRVLVEDLEALVAVGIVGIAVAFGEESTAEQVRATLGDLHEAIVHLDPHLREQRHERAGLGPVLIPTVTEQGEQ